MMREEKTESKAVERLIVNITASSLFFHIHLLLCLSLLILVWTDYLSVVSCYSVQKDTFFFYILHVQLF